MRELLTEVLDTLFPPTKHAKRLRHLSVQEFDETYELRLIDDVYVLSRYTDPLVQAAVHENKFHHSKQAASLLARHCNRWLDGRSFDTLHPIPLGRARIRERGHNQVMSILHYSRYTEVIRTDLLFRDRETAPQSHLNRSERRRNISGAFSANMPSTLTHPLHIMIVDDVMTTGATLKEARATLAPLLPAGSQITLLAVAH